MTHSMESLIAFRDRVAASFEAKQIRSPVHLNSDEQANHLIRIFRDIKPDDWVFSTWRSSWHCLLKGWPEEELFQEILDGHSMHLMSDKYRVLCSSIVAGHLPIAAGVALGIKRSGGPEKVWVFLGDMAASGGLYSEFSDFIHCQRLPVNVVLEDNGFSTDTPTEEAWGCWDGQEQWQPGRFNYYEYQRSTPHVGTGKFVQF